MSPLAGYFHVVDVLVAVVQAINAEIVAGKLSVQQSRIVEHKDLRKPCARACLGDNPRALILITNSIVDEFPSVCAYVFVHHGNGDRVGEGEAVVYVEPHVAIEAFPIRSASVATLLCAIHVEHGHRLALGYVIILVEPEIVVARVAFFVLTEVFGTAQGHPNGRGVGNRFSRVAVGEVEGFVVGRQVEGQAIGKHVS